jgi:type II secretory pathway pseudopilin PulG
MTLIEILVVLFIVALMAGGMLAGSGLFSGAEQRMAAALVVSAVRKGLSEANVAGRPTRLAFDFTANRLLLEQSSSSVALRATKKLSEQETERFALDLAKEAEAEAQSLTNGMIEHKPTFLPTNALGQDGDLPGRFLGNKVKLRLVQTEHDEEPIVEGVAYIYLWPGGVAERAVVQLGEGEREGVTVTLSSLTGRARIERGRIPLPEGRSGEEYSEREDR